MTAGDSSTAASISSNAARSPALEAVAEGATLGWAEGLPEEGAEPGFFSGNFILSFDSGGTLTFVGPAAVAGGAAALLSAAIGALPEGFPVGAFPGPFAPVVGGPFGDPALSGVLLAPEGIGPFAGAFPSADFAAGICAAVGPLAGPLPPAGGTPLFPGRVGTPFPASDLAPPGGACSPEEGRGVLFAEDAGLLEGVFAAFPTGFFAVLTAGWAVGNFGGIVGRHYLEKKKKKGRKQFPTKFS